MSGDVLVVLAQWAGQTVAAAAVTDVWEAVRGQFAGLLGRGDARRAEVAERWLAQTREQLAAAAPTAALERAREAQAERWTDRFADLLDEDPGVEAELRALVEEVAARLPAGAASAAGHSVAAGRDMRITASGGGIAAGVIHGNVALPDPTLPGPAQGIARPGERDLPAGAVVADRGGTAIAYAGVSAAAGGTGHAGPAGAEAGVPGRA